MNGLGTNLRCDWAGVDGRGRVARGAFFLILYWFLYDFVQVNVFDVETDLGAILERLGAIFGPLGGILGASWNHLERPWGL